MNKAHLPPCIKVGPKTVATFSGVILFCICRSVILTRCSIKNLKEIQSFILLSVEGNGILGKKTSVWCLTLPDTVMMRIGRNFPNDVQEPICPFVLILYLDSLKQLLLSLMSKQALRQLSEVKLEKSCHCMNINLLQSISLLNLLIFNL